jgi:hypothetical protein
MNHIHTWNIADYGKLQNCKNIPLKCFNKLIGQDICDHPTAKVFIKIKHHAERQEEKMKAVLEGKVNTTHHAPAYNPCTDVAFLYQFHQPRFFQPFIFCYLDDNCLI